MKPGELRILTRFIGFNLTQVSLRRENSFSHQLRDEDTIIVIEYREMHNSWERGTCAVLSKFGILWCFMEDIERHTVKA